MGSFVWIYLCFLLPLVGIAADSYDDDPMLSKMPVSNGTLSADGDAWQRLGIALRNPSILTSFIWSFGSNTVTGFLLSAFMPKVAWQTSYIELVQTVHSPKHIERSDCDTRSETIFIHREAFVNLYLTIIHAPYNRAAMSLEAAKQYAVFLRLHEERLNLAKANGYCSLRRPAGSAQLMGSIGFECSFTKTTKFFGVIGDVLKKFASRLLTSSKTAQCYTEEFLVNGNDQVSRLIAVVQPTYGFWKVEGGMLLHKCTSQVPSDAEKLALLPVDNVPQRIFSALECYGMLALDGYTFVLVNPNEAHQSAPLMWRSILGNYCVKVVKGEHCDAWAAIAPIVADTLYLGGKCAEKYATYKQTLLNAFGRAPDLPSILEYTTFRDFQAALETYFASRSQGRYALLNWTHPKCTIAKVQMVGQTPRFGMDASIELSQQEQKMIGRLHQECLGREFVHDWITSIHQNETYFLAIKKF